MPNYFDKLVKKLNKEPDDMQMLTDNEELKEEVKNKFLDTISMVESSGGKNLKHKEMKSGIHSGDRAIGQYGLMPNTIDELINRRKLAEADISDVQNLKGMDQEALQQAFKDNPELEEEFANQLADFVLNKSRGDEEKAAYLWNQGHNTNMRKLENDDFKDKEYVKRYQKFRKMFNDEK